MSRRTAFLQCEVQGLEDVRSKIAEMVPNLMQHMEESAGPQIAQVMRSVAVQNAPVCRPSRYRYCRWYFRRFRHFRYCLHRRAHRYCRRDFPPGRFPGPWPRGSPWDYLRRGPPPSMLAEKRMSPLSLC